MLSLLTETTIKELTQNGVSNITWNYLDNKAEIAVWQITETEKELTELSSVPNDEMEEISLIRSESQRKQKLAVRALMAETAKMN